MSLPCQRGEWPTDHQGVRLRMGKTRSTAHCHHGSKAAVSNGRAQRQVDHLHIPAFRAASQVRASMASIMQVHDIGIRFHRIQK